MKNEVVLHKSFSLIFLLSFLIWSPCVSQLQAQCVRLIDDSFSVPESNNSIALVNGKPAITFTAEPVFSSSLVFVQADDEKGTTWGSPVTLDANGTFSSLAVINGHPAVAYYQEVSQDLYFIRALDADGNTWGTPIQIDTEGNVGEYASLIEVNGKPAISFFNKTDGDLNFVRALDENGSIWGTPIVVDETGNVGLGTSMIVIGDVPCISYHGTSPNKLKFVSAKNENGTSWNFPMTLDDNNVGLNSSLSVSAIGNLPIISYYANGDLKFIHAFFSDGSSWNIPTTVDETGDVGNYSSLTTIGYFPAISYYDETNKKLKFIQASDELGATWYQPYTIGTESAGLHSSLINSGGLPMVSFSGENLNLYFTDFISMNPSHNALSFDGIDDRAETMTSFTDNTENVTMETWVKWNGLSAADNSLILYNGNTGSNGYGIIMSEDGMVRILLGGIYNFPVGTLVANEWTHLALVNEEGEWHLFLNGEEPMSTLLETAFAPTPIVKIGGNPDYNEFFDGAIADVRLWNIARTAPEIQNNMYNPPSVGTPGLIAKFEMNQDNCGPILLDTGQQLNATLYGIDGDNYLPQFFEAGELISSNKNLNNPKFEINIFPNPTSGMLNIDYKGNTSATSISLYDIIGSQIKSIEGTKKEIDLTDLPSGVYMLKFSFESQNLSKKIILQE